MSGNKMEWLDQYLAWLDARAARNPEGDEGNAVEDICREAGVPYKDVEGLFTKALVEAVATKDDTGIAAMFLMGYYFGQTTHRHDEGMVATGVAEA
jgi:hypothetical protein